MNASFGDEGVFGKAFTKLFDLPLCCVVVEQSSKLANWQKASVQSVQSVPKKKGKVHVSLSICTAAAMFTILSPVPHSIQYSVPHFMQSTSTATLFYALY